MGEIVRQVIAMGDGGTDDKTPVLDLYILAQTKKTNPRICFLPTASGDNMGYANYFKQLFSRYPCRPSYLALFHPTTSHIREFIMEQDVIYVGGGHSKSMLGVWKEWEVDKYLREAYENGTILSGGSAGSVCWFEQCITDSIPGALTVMNCLGILPMSNCPHFASRERREAFSHYVSTNEIKEGYAADDFAALHFVNGKLERCVSSRPYAKCYKVGKDAEGKVFQKRLKTKFLGEKQHQEEFLWSAPCFSYLKDEEENHSEDAEMKPEEAPAETPATQTEAQTELLQPQATENLPALPASTNATDSDTKL